jgi:hypothetical protein
MAGEGSLRERGLRPLSNSLPLSNTFKYIIVNIYLFERGIKGVRWRQ